jgi:hypothetical protein
LRKGLNRIGAWFIDLKERQLKALQQTLKVNLEDLKKETSYYKTRSILERYDESERDKAARKERQQSPKSQAKQSHAAALASPQSLRLSPPQTLQPSPHQSLNRQQVMPPQQPQFKTPNWIDRLMDALIGDDSRNQKYALICQQCFNHNGLAEPETFAQGLRYRCPNCRFMNIKAPPRQQVEEIPPRIELHQDAQPVEQELLPIESEKKTDSTSSSPQKSKKTTKKTNKAD